MLAPWQKFNQICTCSPFSFSTGHSIRIQLGIQADAICDELEAMGDITVPIREYAGDTQEFAVDSRGFAEDSRRIRERIRDGFAKVRDGYANLRIEFARIRESSRGFTRIRDQYANSRGFARIRRAPSTSLATPTRSPPAPPRRLVGCASRGLTSLRAGGSRSDSCTLAYTSPRVIHGDVYIFTRSHHASVL